MLFIFLREFAQQYAAQILGDVYNTTGYSSNKNN